ncbi:sulfatase-like hydrolase/transferase [Lacinutrix chionoecetis]
MIKDLRTNLKPISRLTLFLSLPWLLVIVLGWFVMPYTRGYLKEIIAFGFLTLICLALALLFNNRNKVQWFLWFLLSVLAFIKLSFYINYGVKLSASALFVIFETNATEASDFVTNYFNIKIIGLLLLFTVVLIISVFYSRKTQISNFTISKSLKYLCIGTIFISAFCIYYKLSRENLVLNSLISYQDYKTAKANLKETLAKEDTNALQRVTTLNEQQTYVVVIGESISNWHMQLYGYERETNPKLTEIKNELLIFDSVITPNVHTIVALDKILTLSDYNNPNKKENASIVQLANKAGFETFWISNQKPVGLHESIPTLIGSAAKHKNFIATDHSGYDIYDEKLLPYLQKALNNKANKKMIFLHLIGNHSRYLRRYPKAYQVFNTEREASPFKHKRAITLINEYDNATLYNDFVLREIIEEVRRKDENSYVLYLSDHGDDVFDTFDFVGHNEYHATPPMYEVPFIVWFSKDYKLKNPELIKSDSLVRRPYVLDDFIHSFSEISNISFDEFNAEKSIFSSYFKKKPRLIKQGEDYDKR